MKWSWHMCRRNEFGQNLRGIGCFGNRDQSTVDEALEAAFDEVRKEVRSDTYLNRKARLSIEIEIDTTEVV